MTSQALFYCNKDGRSDVGNLKNYFVTPPLQNPGSAPEFHSRVVSSKIHKLLILFEVL